MRKLFTSLTLILICSGLSAFEADSIALKSNAKDSDSKIKYKFGGTIDVRLYSDTYESVDARDGAIYFYPKAPSYDAAGYDLNQNNQLRASAYATRLNFGVSNIKALGADASAYIETDFFGSSDNYIQLVRLRHAYMKFNWEKSSLLLGQTYNITLVDEIVSSIIDVGGGLPFNPLNRGVQARFTHKFTPNVEIRAAAEMFNAYNSVGPSDAQSNAGIPEVDFQMLFGNNKSVLGGFTVSGKVLQPRTVDNSGYKADESIASYSVNGFLKFYVKDYCFKFWGIYGSNLTHLLMNGGYGKVAGESTLGDYSLANVYTASSWFDFETPRFSKFQFGLFAAHQANLGSKTALDLTTDSDGNYSYGYYRNCEINWFACAAPRVMYHAADKLAFSFEYIYNVAEWSKEVDEYFEPIETYDPTVNNRLVLALKYVF